MKRGNIKAVGSAASQSEQKFLIFWEQKKANERGTESK